MNLEGISLLEYALDFRLHYLLHPDQDRQHQRPYDVMNDRLRPSEHSLLTDSPDSPNTQSLKKASITAQHKKREERSLHTIDSKLTSTPIKRIRRNIRQARNTLLISRTMERIRLSRIRREDLIIVRIRILVKVIMRERSKLCRLRHFSARTDFILLSLEDVDFWSSSTF